MRFNRFNIEDWDEFERKFIKVNKLKFTGDGSYSTVYSNPKEDFVFKVTASIAEYALDGYMLYLKQVVLKNINNPYVPKIYGVNVYEYEYYDRWSEITRKAHRFIIKMERLHPYTSVHPDTRDKVVNGIYDIDKKELATRDDKWNTNRLVDYWFDQVEHYLRTPKAAQVKRRVRSPKLLKVLMEIKEQQKRPCVDFDFHGGNFMWRKLPNDEQQLVIIDPLY